MSKTSILLPVPAKYAACVTTHLLDPRKERPNKTKEVPTSKQRAAVYDKYIDKMAGWFTVPQLQEAVKQEPDFVFSQAAVRSAVKRRLDKGDLEFQYIKKPGRYRLIKKSKKQCQQ